MKMSRHFIQKSRWSPSFLSPATRQAENRSKTCAADLKAAASAAAKIYGFDIASAPNATASMKAMKAMKAIKAMKTNGKAFMKAMKAMKAMKPVKKP